MLIHVGMDTVKMNGKGFDVKTKVNERVKDQGGKKILKKHIENARFFKVLEETELCDIDYPKEMQAMLAKRGKSS